MNTDVQLPCRFVDIVHLRRLPVHVTVIPSGDHHTWHECVYVLHGLYTVTLQGRKHRLTKGQCAVYPAGMVHHADIDAAARGETDMLEILVLQWNCQVPPRLPPILPAVSPRIPELLSWLADIRLKGSATADVLDAIVFTFLNELTHNSAVGSLVRLVHDYMQGYVSRGLDSRHRETVSLDVFAQSAGISKYHFLREFKKQAGGRTPMEYVQEFRVEKVQEFLTQSNMSLTEIAQRLGFGSRNYLANFVTRRFGVSPRVLRRRQPPSVRPLGQE